MAQRTLRELISFNSTLQDAWHSVRSTSHPQSAGPDGVTCEEFARNARQELKRIRRELRDGTYRFGRFLGRKRRKRSNPDPDDPRAWRPISIASIRDRVVHRAILDRIWPRIRDQVHTEASFGGVRRYKVRRGRSSRDRVHPEQEEGPKSVETAARRIVELRHQGYEWVFETDIESFFQHIDKDRLLAKLSSLLNDHSIDDLLRDAVDTTVVNADEFSPALQGMWSAQHGVPQGGVLSSTLANLYLFDVDEALSQVGLKPVRYLDDLVVLARSEDDAKRAYDLCESLLRDLNLSIHEPGVESNGRVKTAFHAPGDEYDFLGLTFTRQSIKPRAGKMEEFYQRLSDLTDWRRPVSLVKVIQDLDGYTKAWFSAYKFCNIPKADLKQIDKHIEWRIRKWLAAKEVIPKAKRLSPKGYAALGVPLVQTMHIAPILRGDELRAS